MQVIPTEIPDLLLIEPRAFVDPRGFFMESFNARDFAATTGLNVTFVQDNHSRSSRGVLRGLHYQITEPQGKLLRVVSGEIYDVAVDLRRSSPTFGRHLAIRMSDARHQMIYIPPGFAHGFCVLSDVADILYKATGYYNPSDERTILWSDPKLKIPWPVSPDVPLILSAKDERGTPFEMAETYA